MGEHVCPVWIGYLLLSPFRKLFENPNKMIEPHIKQGDTVLEVGPAMGYFSLPIARMVGPSGRVVCVDIQKRMLEKLSKRAKKAGLANTIEPRLCERESLLVSDLTGKVDFAIAIHVLHEIPSALPIILEQVFTSLKPGGKLFIAEPKGHVSVAEFKVTMKKACESGLNAIESSTKTGTLCALMQKPIIE